MSRSPVKPVPSWALFVVSVTVALAPSARGVAQRDRTTVVTDRLKDLPFAVEGAAAVANSSSIFVFGGETERGLSSTVLRLDGRTGAATVLTDRVVPRRDHKVVLVDEHTAVVLGGHGRRGVLATVEVVDLDTGKVRPGAAMPTPRAGLGAAFVGGRIVTAGGSLGWGKVDTVEIYDVKRDRWFRAPGLAEARDGVLVNVDGLVYAVGGKTDRGASAVVERFDGQRFVKAPALPAPLSGHGAVSAFGKILTVNGDDDPRLLLFFDPVARDVVRFRTAHAPRRGAAVVSLGERIVLVGGREGDRPVATVEMISFR